MFCHSCGKEIEDGIRFCRYCGAAQDSADTAPAGTAGGSVPPADPVPAQSAPAPQEFNTYTPVVSGGGTSGTWSTSGTYNAGGANGAPAAGVPQGSGNYAAPSHAANHGTAGGSLSSLVILLALGSAAGFLLAWNWSIYGILSMCAVAVLIYALFRSHEGSILFPVAFTVFAARFIWLDLRHVFGFSNVSYSFLGIISRILLYLALAATWMIFKGRSAGGLDMRRTRGYLCLGLGAYAALSVLQNAWNWLVNLGNGGGIYRIRNVFFFLAYGAFVLAYYLMGRQEAERKP